MFRITIWNMASVDVFRGSLWLLVAAAFALTFGRAAARRFRSGPAQPAPMRGYAGPQVRIPGIFVTPIANAPFSATVHIVSHQKLPDGTEHVVMTINHVARTSSGIIYQRAAAG